MFLVISLVLFIHLWLFCSLARGWDEIGVVLDGPTIRTFTGISLSDCWTECANRPSCLSINFRPIANVCFLKNGNKDSNILVQQFGSMYRQKSSEEPVNCGTSTCKVGEMCNTITNVCEIRECPPLLETSDVTILGNMWSISSKAILRCRSGYIPLSSNKSTVATSCGNNGVWSEELTCEPAQKTTSAPTTTTPSTTTPAFPCPPDDTVFRTVSLGDNSNLTYRVFKTLANQTEAAANCLREGGFLIRLTTIAKMNTMLALTSCSEYAANDYFVDGSNIQSGPTWSTWIMSNNESLSMSTDFWAVARPSSPDIQHCVRMHVVWGHKLNDCFCSNQYFYICEK